MHIEQNILDKVNEWLTPTFDDSTQVAIKEMMTSSPKDLEESFYSAYGPAGSAQLHEQFCQRLAHIIGSEEQWSDLANFVACVLVGKRSRAQHQHRATQIAEQMSNHVYCLGDEVFGQ